MNIRFITVLFMVIVFWTSLLSLPTACKNEPKAPVSPTDSIVNLADTTPQAPPPPPPPSPKQEEAIQKQKAASPFNAVACCNQPPQTPKDDCCCQPVLDAYKQWRDQKALDQIVKAKTKDPLFARCMKRKWFEREVEQLDAAANNGASFE